MSGPPNYGYPNYPPQGTQQGYGYGYPPPGQFSPAGQYPPAGVPPPSTTYGSAALGTQGTSPGNARYDDEDPYKFDDAAVRAKFAESKVRKGFVAKVFTILLIQLGVTLGVACLFIFTDSINNYIRNGGSWVVWTSYVVAIVLLLVLVCGGNIARKYPANMVLLFLFTIAMSVFVATNTVFYDANEVAMAFGITCGAVLGLTAFALLPCVDFTMCGGAIAALSFTLLFAVLIGIFVSMACRTKDCFNIVGLVIASIAVLVFSVYIVYDIQLVMGGKRMEIGPDDYVFAALNLYVDIIMLFLYVLQIVGIANR